MVKTINREPMHGLHGSVYFHGDSGKWLAQVTTLKVRAHMQSLKFDLRFLSPSEAVFAFTADRAKEVADILKLGHNEGEFICLSKRN